MSSDPMERPNPRPIATVRHPSGRAVTLAAIADGRTVTAALMRPDATWEGLNGTSRAEAGDDANGEGGFTAYVAYSGPSGRRATITLYGAALSKIEVPMGDVHHDDPAAMIRLTDATLAAAQAALETLEANRYGCSGRDPRDALLALAAAAPGADLIELPTPLSPTVVDGDEVDGEGPWRPRPPSSGRVERTDAASVVLRRLDDRLAAALWIGVPRDSGSRPGLRLRPIGVETSGDAGEDLLESRDLRAQPLEAMRALAEILSLPELEGPAGEQEA